MPELAVADYQRKELHPYPLLLRPQDLADRLGVTRRQIYALMKHPDPARRLPRPFKIGRATMWRIETVQDWIERQSASSAPN